jgi:diguanylate cyclase (GGDEF)-like protein
MRRFLRSLLRPSITDNRDLRRYVGVLTVSAIIIALAIDTTNQLLFFTGWNAAFRSWFLTVFAVVVIAVPAGFIFGRAQRDLYRTKQDLEKLSRTDPLTGLPNRRALIEASEAPEPRTMVLVIADIDRFKNINDTYGHRIGDTVLQTVGAIMTAHLAGYGLVGRLGGEEFALISSDVSVDRIVPALWDFLHAIARTPIVVPGAVVHVTLSAGVATRSSTDPFDRLYAEADEALYLAKRNGRNRIEFSARVRERMPPEAPASRPGLA